MAVHSLHPGTHTHGLADDCERCAQHAREPWVGLDEENLRNLVYRYYSNASPRSVNEATALRNIGGLIHGAKQIGMVFPATHSIYRGGVGDGEGETEGEGVS